MAQRSTMQWLALLTVAGIFKEKKTNSLKLIIQNILAQITSTVGGESINIANLSNQSKGDYAVTIIDVDKKVSASAIDTISKVEGIIKVREINK